MLDILVWFLLYHPDPHESPCYAKILVKEAKHDSGELCCPATALIVPLNCQSQQLSSALSSACDFKSFFANSVDTDQTASLGAV